MKNWWYVYILYNQINNRFYIGYTNDIRQRLYDHNRGQTHTTKRMQSKELVYVEACLSKEDATKRERQLKTGYGRRYLRERLKNYLRARSSVG